MARPLGNGSISQIARKSGQVWVLNYRDRAGISRRKVLYNTKGERCRTVSEARKAQNRIIHERDYGQASSSTEWDAGFALEKYLADLGTRTKEAHVENFRRSIERILAELHVVEVGEIGLARVLAWRDDRRKSVSPATCNHDTTALHSFVKWMVRRQMLPSDPLLGLDPLPKKQSRPMRSFSESELARFFEAVAKLDQDRLSTRQAILPITPVFRGLATTGMRYGEFRQVRWADIDASGSPAITVRATTAKNGRPRRVPIQTTQLEDLLAMRNHQASVLGQLPAQSRPVWLSSRGQQLYTKSSSLLRILREVLEIAGIDKVNEDGEALVLHSFRHTHCTRLLRAGVPPQHVMQLLGHRTQDMVMRVYNHMSSEDARDSISRLPEIPGPYRVQTNTHREANL